MLRSGFVLQATALFSLVLLVYGFAEMIKQTFQKSLDLGVDYFLFTGAGMVLLAALLIVSFILFVRNGTADLRVASVINILCSILTWGFVFT